MLISYVNDRCHIFAPNGCATLQISVPRPTHRAQARAATPSHHQFLRPDDISDRKQAFAPRICGAADCTGTVAIFGFARTRFRVSIRGVEWDKPNCSRRVDVAHLVRPAGLPLLVGILLLVLWAAPVQAESALEMASFCRPIVGAQAGSTEDTLLLPHTYEFGVCWGAFAAIQTALHVSVDPYRKDTPALKICLPEKSTRAQLVLVFLKYVDDHPESAHEDQFHIVLRAFWEAFPCG